MSELWADRLVPEMDHPHYIYTASPRRPRIVWPGGALTALLIRVDIDTYDETPAAGPHHRDPRHASVTAPFSPEHRAFSQHEYGPRVGVFRILELLDRHGLRATCPVTAVSAGRYPFLMGELTRRGYEIAGHGVRVTRMLSSRMSEAEEAGEIAQSLEGLRNVFGQAPVGWFGPGAGESERTPQLLDAAGLSYVGDWSNDDQPYLMTTPRHLVSLPAQPDWDDVEQLWFRALSMATWRDAAIEAFEVLHGEEGRVFTLTLHPWLIGMPHRIRYLAEVLEAVAGRDGVWNATAAEIVAHAGPVLRGAEV
jgi:peptidoglycan/xylan/chitin deacetylase (PgdA/CDA1 family)